MQITLYTDGACDLHAENRPGGWAAILRATDGHGALLKETVLSGGAEHTTNNQMELTAVIEALKQLQKPSIIEVVSDSKYVIEIASGRNRAKKNRDLWQEYFHLAEKHKITWQYVAGHSDNEFNERCDRLAVAERQKVAQRVTENPVDRGDNEPREVTVHLATKLSTAQARVAWIAYMEFGENVEIIGAVLDDVSKYEAILQATIRILATLGEGDAIRVFAADKTFVTGVNERASRWQQQGWQYNYNDQIHHVKYPDLWQRILHLRQGRTTEFCYHEDLRKSWRYKLARQLAAQLLNGSA